MADTSSVAGITAALPQTTQQNPLQQFSTIVGIQNDMVRNKLLQQGLLNQQQELQNLQLTNETGQTNLAWTKRVNSAKALLGLNSQLDGDMLKNAPDLLEGLRADHNIPDSVYTQIKSDIQNGDAKALRGHIGNGIVATMSGPEGLQAVNGTTRLVTLPSGQTQQVLDPGVLSPPGTQTRNLGSPVGGGLSPAEGADIINVPDGQGHFIPLPKLQVWQAIHGVGSQPPAPNGVPAPVAGATPGATPAPATPPPGSQDIRAPVTAGALLNRPTPTPGEMKTANEARDAQQTDLGYLTTHNFNDMQGSLNSVLNMSPGVDTGKGTALMNTMRQIIGNTMPNVAKMLDIDLNKMNTQQDMFKAMARIARASGHSTDADLFQAQASNVNPEMSPEALQHAAQYIIGLNNKDIVLTREAASRATNEPLDTRTHYANKRNEVQDQTDPNAFHVIYDPKQYQQYKASIANNPTAMKRFNYTLDLMKKHLPPGNGGGMTPVQ